MATIYDLPDEILEYILSLVSPYEDLHSCMSVSKQWKKYVKSKLLSKVFSFNNISNRI